MLPEADWKFWVVVICRRCNITRLRGPEDGLLAADLTVSTDYSSGQNNSVHEKY